MTPPIFVYGSLMAALDHPMGQRLRREAELVGPATVRGRLYRVSWYPGLKRSNDPDHIVHGEIYRLGDPERTLAWLDEYEGITPGGLSVSEADEYARREIPAFLGDGTEVLAWAYIYQRPQPETARVADGRWRG